MKVFIVAKAPTDTNEREQITTLVAEATRQAGHQPFVAYREIASRAITSGEVFMPFVRQQILDSDLMIVLYDPELRGGLIEQGIAYANKIPIWLAHAIQHRVSSSALGCANLILTYKSAKELGVQLVQAYRSLAS